MIRYNLYFAGTVTCSQLVLSYLEMFKVL